MKNTFAIVSFLLIGAGLSQARVARAQDEGLPLPVKSAKNAVNAGNFGVLRLNVDWKGQSQRLATETFLLRRSDDYHGHPVIEQEIFQNGRWKNALNAGNFFPSMVLNDQFDTSKIPFTGDILSILNASIANGTLANSEKLASDGKSPVEFTLSWDPKGHTPGKSVDIKGFLHHDSDKSLSFVPADAAGEKIKPLMDALVAQLVASDAATDEVGSAVVLFGKVDAKGGLTLENTAWSCEPDGLQVPTKSTSYSVSDDSNASLQNLLRGLEGKNVIVRAVLTDGDHPSAKVLGVVGKIDWNQPITDAPGGVVVANGGTLSNLNTDEMQQVLDRRAEITNVDSKTGFVSLRVPNRKGVSEPNTGYVPIDKTHVLVAAADAKVYTDIPLPGGDMAGKIERSFDKK